MLRVFLFALAVAILLPLRAVVVLLAAAQARCENGIPTAKVIVPGGDRTTEAQFVDYFESEGIPANAAAGITGNLYQESGLNPTEPGYGLAQWNPSWWATASAWISARGRNPNTAGGQLTYIAANLTSDADDQWFYPGLKSDMYGATSPQEAAIRWMNDYEQCQGAGAPGTLNFDPAGLCMGEQRESYAAQAMQAARGASSAGGDAFASLQLSGVCNASYPLTGSVKVHEPAREGDRNRVGAHRPGRRRGHDPGLAAACVRAEHRPADRPGLLRGTAGDHLEDTTGPLANKWWYWSEQIQPTVGQGQKVAAGPTVATYAPAGTGIEIGWWTPNGGYSFR